MWEVIFHWISNFHSPKSVTIIVKQGMLQISLSIASLSLFSKKPFYAAANLLGLAPPSAIFYLSFVSTLFITPAFSFSASFNLKIMLLVSFKR